MKNNCGYVALMTVLILGVVASVIATSLVMMGLDHSRTALSESRSAIAKSAADACIDDALRQIRLVPSYAGTGNLTLADATCSYTVIAASTSSITAMGISGNSTRRATVNLSARMPNIVISKWEEN